MVCKNSKTYFGCACPLFLNLVKFTHKSISKYLSLKIKAVTPNTAKEYSVQSRTVMPSEKNGAPYLRNLSLNVRQL